MINAVVKGQGLKINHPKVVADTIAYLEMSVEFKTADWDGLVKYVHFTLGDEHYAFELVDDKITQDMHLDLPEGEWEVYIHGSDTQGGEVVQRITTEPVILFVYRTGDLDGEPFPELSGSVGEQTIAKANEAIEVANSVRKDADEGKFDGEDGHTPKKGEDYFTEEDIAEIVERVAKTVKVEPAKIGYVTLLADAWVGEESPYSQVVAVEGATENSQVDLTPSVEQLSIFHHKDLAFVTENEDGVVTVYAIGDKPLNDYTIQVTITEVA